MKRDAGKERRVWRNAILAVLLNSERGMAMRDVYGKAKSMVDVGHSWYPPSEFRYVIHRMYLEKDVMMDNYGILSINPTRKFDRDAINAQVLLLKGGSKR